MVSETTSILESLSEGFGKIDLKALRKLMGRSRGEDRDCLDDAIDAIEDIEDRIDTALDALNEIEEDD